jgi:alpha,alpha-trehalase
VEALRRYGYGSDADRISQKFLSLVQQEFLRYGTIEEKYDVVRRQSNVRKSLRYGYRTNEAGFGWTNSVFTALFDELPPSDQQKLLAAH